MELCSQALVACVPDAGRRSISAILRPRTFAEFFAGIGLVRIALERQGWRIAYANDIDPRKYEMYKGHFRDSDEHFHLGDIHHVAPGSVPSISLATASFPCNDLSVAGGRLGLKGRQSSAFWGFLSLIEGMGERRPPIILVENVVGFLTCREGRDFQEAMIALNELGYTVDPFVLDALLFVPQSRPRLFVVATMDQSKPSGEFPETAGLEENCLRPKKLIQFISGHPEVRWNLRKLAIPSPKRLSLTALLDDLPEDAPEWWSRERTDYLLNQMSCRHRLIARRMISASHWSFGTVFRRMRHGKSMAELRSDGVAGCLRTPRGGSGRQILLKAGFGKNFARLLTPRECAKLMGAAEYCVGASLNQALFGFGDAVCVPVIEWIARNYLNPLVDELLGGN